MTKMTISFIGCGKLGKVIAKLLSDQKAIEIKGIVNTTLKSTQEAIDFIGSGTACSSIGALPGSDIYFVTTPDDEIKEVFRLLVKKPDIDENTIVVHCSGSLSSDDLSNVNLKRCQMVSIHPIKSFAHPSDCIGSFQGTFCAIEGSLPGSSIIKQLFENMGAIIFSINKSAKHLYHAAGAMANNYLVTLNYHALQCYLEAGIEESMAKTLVTMLMQDAFNNLLYLSHEKALTGPIQRGDIDTVSKHIKALEKHPIARNIYTALGNGTLPITNHDDVKKRKLFDVLSVGMVNEHSRSP